MYSRCSICSGVRMRCLDSGAGHPLGSKGWPAYAAVVERTAARAVAAISDFMMRSPVLPIGEGGKIERLMTCISAPEPGWLRTKRTSSKNSLASEKNLRSDGMCPCNQSLDLNELLIRETRQAVSLAARRRRVTISWRALEKIISNRCFCSVSTVIERHTARFWTL